MEYRPETNSGNYAVVIAMLFGALGIAYGVAQIIGAGPAEVSSAGGAIYLGLMAGGVWGVIGLVFGAMISALINRGFWSIPIILILVLAFQSSKQ
jgi:hypothetical protein